MRPSPRPSQRANRGTAHRRGAGYVRQQPATSSSAVQLVLVLVVAASVVLVWSRRPQREAPGAPSPAPTATDEAAEINYAERLPGSKDFRFLLAILTGVALGVAVVALQKMYELATWHPEFVVLSLFWVDSFTAVVLVYLAVKYGSVVFDLRIDAVETVLLMVVTIAECGMFISVALGPGPNLSLHWFVSLSAFGLAAFCMTAWVNRRLRLQLRERATKALQEHVKSLPGDILMALMTCLGAASYASIDPHPSAKAAFIAGTAVLIFLTIGIIKQGQMRRRIFS